MYNLSILIPSAYPDKLNRLIGNLKETMANFNETEIVICEDGTGPTTRNKNFVYCYSPPSKYRSTFHEKPVLESSGRWMMMANDDMLFKTQGWDLLIPYDKFPDDLGMFHFKDNVFNEKFACHPVFSRRVIRLQPGILSPLYQITKCDNTIWDIYPPNRRMYLPNIEIDHQHEPYGPEWKDVYDEDNVEYIKYSGFRAEIRSQIQTLAGEANAKIMIGVVTAEDARKAIFYDHYQVIEKPMDTICVVVHGQSIANNRNKIVEQALIHNVTHLLFLDDDVIANPDIIYQLLKHNKDIVLALQLRRNFPHDPLIFDMEMPGDLFRIYTLKDGERGLIPVVSGGLGAVLIKTDVFKSLSKPIFRFGEFQPDQMAEDTGFYKRAAHAGFEIYCDLDCHVGHIATAIIRPALVNDMWTVNYDTGSSGSVSIPLRSIQQEKMVKV